MVDVYITREGNRLGAVDPISAEAIASLGAHETFVVKLQRPRNPKHHRKLFALLGLVFENQNTFPTIEQLLEALKMATGLFDVRRSVEGLPFTVPRSISFASMDQKSFSEWYDKVIEVIVTKVLPGVNKKELEAQVLEIIGDFKTTGRA